MNDTAPDVALPLRVDPAAPAYIFDANHCILGTCFDPSEAERLVSAVNNAAAKDAEIARLRTALETNGSMDFFRDGAKHMHDAVVSQKIHADWGTATPDDGVTLALDLTRDLAAKTLAALSSNAKAGSALNAPTDPRDAEIARLRDALETLDKAADDFRWLFVDDSGDEPTITLDADVNRVCQEFDALSDASKQARAALSSIPTEKENENHGK